MKEAVMAVIQRPRLLIEQLVTYLVLGVLAYQWLGLPVGRWWQVAVVAITALLGLAALFFSGRRAFRQLQRDAAGLPSPKRAAAAVALAVAGIAGMYLLLVWVPAFESFAAQLLSFAIRFGLGYLLLIGCWLTIAALMSARSPTPSGAS